MSLSPSSSSSHCAGNGCDLRLVQRSFRGVSRYVCDVCGAFVEDADCPPAGAPQGVNEAASSLATPVVSGQRAGTRWAAFSAEEQACLLVALALLGLGNNTASSYVGLALRLQVELNAVWEAS